MRPKRRSLLQGLGALAITLLGGPLAKLRARENEPDPEKVYMTFIGGPSLSMGGCPPVDERPAGSYPWTFSGQPAQPLSLQKSNLEVLHLGRSLIASNPDRDDEGFAELCKRNAPIFHLRPATLPATWTSPDGSAPEIIAAHQDRPVLQFKPTGTNDRGAA